MSTTLLLREWENQSQVPMPSEQRPAPAQRRSKQLAGLGIPDLEYIRKRISIQDVARELGLWVNNRQGCCWRIETHRNGDSNPSICGRPRTDATAWPAAKPDGDGGAAA